MKSLGNFIRYVRKTKGLTQEQVSEKLNIVPPVLSKWENDKSLPPLEMLFGLCNILEVSIEECISAELSDGEKILPPRICEPIKLGKNIKRLRIKNGWSQSELGKNYSSLLRRSVNGKRAEFRLWKFSENFRKRSAFRRHSLFTAPRVLSKKA